MDLQEALRVWQELSAKENLSSRERGQKNSALLAIKKAKDQGQVTGTSSTGFKLADGATLTPTVTRSDTQAQSTPVDSGTSDRARQMLGNTETPVQPVTTYSAPPPTSAAPVETAALEEYGIFETPRLPDVTLPDIERVDPLFGNAFDQMYAGNLEAETRNLGELYNFDPARMDAAQLDIGGLPQVDAALPESFDALDFLLAGQGFDDATLSRMRALATDDISRQGANQRGSTRLMAEQAGLAGSPAALALEAQATRRQGDATTRALQEIEVQNALQGVQNRQVGAGMELNRQTSAASQANQVALQNAMNIIAGMQQNVANLQQSNLVNQQTEQGQRLRQADQQANLYGQGSNAYNQAALGRAQEADFFNAASGNARDLNQAQFDRQGAQFDIGNDMTRYGWDTANLVNLANQSQAQNFYNQGTNLTANQSFESPWGNLFTLGGG